MGDRRIAQHTGARPGAITLTPYPQTEIRQASFRSVNPFPLMLETDRLIIRPSDPAFAEEVNAAIAAAEAPGGGRLQFRSVAEIHRRVRR
jgi:hypothetical protein